LERVDVVIVGSGAAGSVLAARLAQGGKRVVVLEAGPERHLTDLYNSQIWSRRLKWPVPQGETGGADPISMNFASGWGTGGSALHHYAGWFRLHPEDFELRTRFKRGLDWPISYDELRPYYDEIQREVGISGDAAAEVWRPPGDPYPMPPLPVFKQASLLAEGFKRLGLRTAPQPMAINSVAYGGRLPCVNDGWCDAGCPFGALANPLATHLPQAVRAGATLRHNAFVMRVLVNEKEDRVTGVEYCDVKGQRRVQEADVVVLAAYAIQTPRILLDSATSRHPAGIANSSGLLGRYVMTHTAANVFGLFEEETDNYLGRTGGQLLSQDTYAKDPRKGYVGSSQWLIGNALKPTDLLGIANSRPELFGRALQRFMEAASIHLATMTFVGESLPHPDNRLVLAGKKDRFGASLVRITHDFGADGVKCYEAGMKQGLEVFREAGAHETWAGPRVRMHMMGGAIMGADPKASVTNGYGQAHDLPNLFIAGSSLFPTSGGVNPTFTLYALAQRTAKYLLQNWRHLA
jgi:choline dehydrogenase-like flavoprotein